MRKFMRTRAPSAAPHKANGISNYSTPFTVADGAGPRRDDHSTLTRYWSESEECGETDKGAPGLGLPVGLGLPGLGLAPDLPLWEDPEFPAAPSSLADRRLAHRTHWLRPHEICSRPRFLGDTAVDAELSTEDMEPEADEQFAARWSVSAGEAGDPHVCCAAAALALTPRLLARVAPPQSFRTRYSGLFRFRFWVFGTWREVAVDDRLPARGGRLLASRAALPDDFTLPLLEKAYAKLHGSYGALRAGSAARALQELSGGVVQSFAPPRQPRALLLQVLHSAVPRSTLLVGSGRRLRNGLIPGQAYCVTGLARVREPAGEDEEHGGTLVRVRAPSGRGEWAGAWARGGPQWRALAEADRELLARRAAEPGHFWMTFSDFARSFARLELVHVGPDDWLSEPALHGKRPWRAVLARRRWRCGYNAGGPPRCRATAHANPQFHVQVPRSDAGKCHVVVSVTQQYAVGAGRRERLHGIGFAVYELPPGAAPHRAALAAAALPALRALDVTHESRAREVVTFFTLPAGQYLVMPHTHRPHVEAAFLLRILTDDHTDVWEVNDDNVIIRDIAAEFMDEGRSLPPELQVAIAKTVGKLENEEVKLYKKCAVWCPQVDAAALLALLRRVWRRVLPARPSLELSRALVALRDPALRGRLAARELPALLARLALWRAALAPPGRCGARLPALRLRALLWACGVSASNKVLECLVLRFARGAQLAPAACVTALARLHLAHERYRALDAKLKSNPLSLEEMILMTIYS
ncbi:calpain-2 catalytic subunit-like [Melitaea cinxia]|uniref:calpain-2 catalytic subunit-like n=1 Tax=Melitaea cinxia TaxID=113334 RepID=UPI001E27272A|nr:calpain-2 catalytic subunit-like [Melitaea cinxia]